MDLAIERDKSPIEVCLYEAKDFYKMLGQEILFENV